VPGEDALRRLLQRIDGRGYKAYRDLRGEWTQGDVRLGIDRVQGDPFAAPSWVRVRVVPAHALPDACFATPARRIAFEDWLARRARDAIARRGESRSGSGKSGLLRIDAGGQEVLERTAVAARPDAVELRLEVGLPAAGRRVLGRAAEALLCDDLPDIARATLAAALSAPEEVEAFGACVENQEHVRSALDALGLVAFVGDGARLPRESGASDRPLRHDARLFEAPDTLRVAVPLAHPVQNADGTRQHEISGLGIPRGVTLVVGGGYHGKSTLLRALERGVYSHVPGDGREWVVSTPGLVKVRAEDGRRVERVDIRPFVADLPGGRSTRSFSSDDASGSTSQAASLVEALEVGATGLLLDEDTCATNFMVRDARMQALVAAEHEPITPFVDRVRELHERLDVSSVLVMGGCGDYFEAADTVIQMREFVPYDVTGRAHRIAAELPTARRREAGSPLSRPPDRVPLPESFDASRGRRDLQIDVRGRDEIRYGRGSIDLRAVEQLVDESQTRAIGHALHQLGERFLDGQRTLRAALDALFARLDEEGLDVLDPFHQPGRHPGRYARPRRFEVAAAVNRLRALRVADGERP
jgi:predicted ABC-class ATPase